MTEGCKPEVKTEAKHDEKEVGFSATSRALRRRRTFGLRIS